MLELFERCSFEQKKFIMFRLGLNYDYLTAKKIAQTFAMKSYFSEAMKAYKFGLKCYEKKQKSFTYMRKYPSDLQHYHNVLSNIKKLASELKLNNSLEICNLYTYLLYNGYLSKTKENLYQILGRNYTETFPQKDIASGKGVCLNYSLFLKDLLKICGYESAVLSNSTKWESIDKPISRLRYSDKDASSLISVLSMLASKKNVGNHLYTLIKDNDGYYIFDPTSYTILSLRNHIKADIVSGKGISKIFLMESYAYAYDESEINVLDQIAFNKDIIIPSYSREDFIYYRNIDKIVFKENNVLIEKFYADARNDIVKMARVRRK